MDTPNTQPPQAPPANAPAEYEFSEAQNAIIGPLAFRMSIIGMLIGAVSLVGFVILMLIWQKLGWTMDTLQLVGPHTLSSLLVLAISVWIARCGNAFRLIVKTKGSDMKNLMYALGEMKKLFGLIMLLLLILIVATGYFFSELMPLLDKVKELLPK
jgi:hypothetical protein